MLNRFVRLCLDNVGIPMLLTVVTVVWGLAVSPFDHVPNWMARDPIAVDAIPDLGENQQIVFTEWPGQTPSDIDDHITHPLTSALLSVPGVQTVRSSSIFGMSSIYVIFDEDVEFYWSRSRILEQLNALPQGLLPDGVQPTLGPDSTALGQVFWYTLEGRDGEGNPTGGWDLHELRTVQDFHVQYALRGVQGVSEVASIGGHVASYQVQVDPDALDAYGLSIGDVFEAVRLSNQDIGAKTVEINQAEYLIRGVGRIDSVHDIEQSVVRLLEGVPITVGEVARVELGPMMRRGVLDKSGVETVGGVVVARYGANPMVVIESLKTQIDKISTGLPEKTLDDGRVSKLTIVPFYDRSELISETLDTLKEALLLEILVTVLVVVLALRRMATALVVATILPLSVLVVFVLMKVGGVTANVVALSGIAIAIGTMVDLGIVLMESVQRHAKDVGDPKEVVYRAVAEVSAPIVTTISTTVLSFIPIFWLESAEGKLFQPLAFTKTGALLAALLMVLCVLPTFGRWMLSLSQPKETDSRWSKWQRGLLILSLFWWLSKVWLPLPMLGFVWNCVLVTALVGGVLGIFYILHRCYVPILQWCLVHKETFLLLPVVMVVLSLNIWLGTATLLKPFSVAGWELSNSRLVKGIDRLFPGMGSEFMPALDEGSFLLMPTSMPHSGVAHNTKVLSQLDALVQQIPEVTMVVGKLGRAETALDPAPISMYENVIQYADLYSKDETGRLRRYAVNDAGEFALSTGGYADNDTVLTEGLQSSLMESEDGEVFRNWRSHIQTPDDIWQEIVDATRLPGVTSAPKLQPIETRLVMLQTGMRAPMGLKVYGPSLDTIEQLATELESILKQVPTIVPQTVFADQLVAKPYLLLDLNREAIARYGLQVTKVQQELSTAIGGQVATTVLKGRERIPVEVRYPRELRESPETLETILLDSPVGPVPLGDLVDIRYEQGPQQIKSEDTFLVGYVLFDKVATASAGDVVLEAKRSIEMARVSGALTVPEGVHYEFSGSYQQQERAMKRLSLLIPMVLCAIVALLYWQFKSISTVAMIFCGVLMSFSGAFLLLWLYGQPWFLNLELGSVNLRSLFQVQTMYLSVAVWVGFVALFGIATDDGVLMGTKLDQLFAERNPDSIESVHQTVIDGGRLRVLPAILTTVTTIVALLPVLTSTGRGADIMIPMAIPTVGGMMVASISYLIVPVLYAWRAERRLFHEGVDTATYTGGVE